ncbi:MAG: hypothetical protein E7175_04085 [Erysipelotrichaceae bacterium]|nr:hypothetical protein [Erysipelotrichaceae bacterium]
MSEMNRVIYIGGGALSLTSSVLLKKRHPEVDVFIVEKDIKLGRKLMMTGGGKCNLAPNKDDEESLKGYNDQEYIKELFDEIPLKRYISLLKEIGIEVKKIKEYGYYPVNEHAPTVVKILTNQIKKLGIKVINDEFIDFDNSKDEIEVILKKQKIRCNKLVLALGGLKEDVLINHNLKFISSSPGLCPIKVKENVASIFGVRMEADISYLFKGNIEYKEHGEIMFKKDALSGITIMNIASLIARKKDISNSQIIIDLTSGNNYLANNKSTVEEYFLSLTKDIFTDYLIKRFALDKNHIILDNEKEEYLKYVSSLSFTPTDLYDYKDAQVTVGGYDINTHIKNVYLLGEMKNIDGLCGGYNLRYVISEGFRFALNYK